MTMKIAIIGSGIGGSGIGALITSETPHTVSCFEQNHIIGGRCGSYKVEDAAGRSWLLDVGCHIFSSCGEGPLGEILNRCGKTLRWSPTKNPGPRVNVMGMELSRMVKTQAQQDKKKEAAGIRKKSLKDFFMETSVEESYKYDDIPLTQFFDEFFTKPGEGSMDRIIYSMQAGVCFGTTPETTSAGEFIRSIGDNFRKMSMGYPIGGGTGVIPELYWEAMKEKGAELILGKEGRVRRIVVENNTVKGVELSNGRFVAADIVIANADIKTTVLKLVGESYFTEDYIRYVKNIKWGGQVCSLKIGVDKIITDQKMLTYVPQMNQEDMQRMFGGAGQANADSGVPAKKIPEKTPLLIVPLNNHDPDLAPEGCQNIHTVTPTAMGESTKWTVEEDKQWEKACMDTLLTLWPEIEGHVVVKEFISTNILDVRFGKEGAGTGTAQSIDQVGRRRPSVISPVKGLYFSSGDAGGWGIGTELAARSALELFDLLKRNDFSNDRIFSARESQ